MSETQNPLNVTAADVEAVIAGVSYLEVAEKQTVIAVMRLTNGQCVIGEAHCLNPDKFSAELGARNAHADAVRKVWPMMAFMARDAHVRQLQAAADEPSPILTMPDEAPRIILPS